METKDVSGIAQQSNINELKRQPKSELGKDDFLKLLIAQLQNQDPLKPMEDREFIAQMAQFSSLEQMKSLNHSFSQLQSYNLIGKTVYAETESPDKSYIIPVYGKVDRVSINGDKIILGIGNIDIMLEDVKAVFDNQTVEATGEIKNA